MTIEVTEQVVIELGSIGKPLPFTDVEGKQRFVAMGLGSVGDAFQVSSKVLA